MKLHKACSDGNLRRIRKCIDEGYDINEQNSNGNTPLHCFFKYYDNDNEDYDIEYMDFQEIFDFSDEIKINSKLNFFILSPHFLILNLVSERHTFLLRNLIQYI